MAMSAPPDPSNQAQALQDKFQQDGISRFFEMAQSQLTGANQTSEEMQKSAHAIQQRIQEQIQGMWNGISNNVKAPVFRVFQHRHNGRRLVARDTEALEGYDSIPIPGADPRNPETTTSFTAALNLAKQNMLAGVKLHTPPSSIDHEARELDAIAGLNDLRAIIASLRRRHFHHSNSEQD